MSRYSDYSKLTLNDLKSELRSRNAKVTGRKAELVERLEAYERNFNFGNIVSTPIVSLHLPSTNLYKDINSQIKLPVLSLAGILSYLRKFGVELGRKPLQMYYGRYLIYVRYYENGDLFYVKAACRAEFKKKTRYVVDIIFNIGEIQSSQCECAAGSSPTAHCKHVCSVFVGINAGHPLLTYETCTQQLQTFHKPQIVYSGSPVKACNIQVNNFQISGKPTNNEIKLSNDPRPAEYVSQPGYNDYVKNLCINFSHNQNRMPVLHLIDPANPSAIQNDHDYLKETPAEAFLQDLNVTKISKEVEIELEKATRQQSACKLWSEERCLRVQSSNYGKICKATERANLHKFAESICNPRSVCAKPIIHGRTFEEVAIKKYESMTNNKVARSGIKIHNTYPYLGTSIDGVVIGKDKIVEIKCPYSARNMTINPDTVSYLEYGSSEVLTLKNNHDYMYQIQGQLEITGTSQCDLVVYTFKDTKIISVKRDQEFFERMLPKLIDFFFDIP